jgi:hypothetical protein
MTEIRQRLALEARACGAEGFEILAITAGAANGWEFPAAVLERSLGLWEGVNCFIDHGQGHRSVRDIAGVLRKVQWDRQRQGIRAELLAFGPSRDLLVELGSQILAEPGENGEGRKLGFSADLLFKGSQQKAEQILKVYSVDLVYEPARGGAFLRALHSREENEDKEGESMQNKEELATAERAPAAETNETAMQDLRTQLAKLREEHSQLSACLLENALENGNLPAAVKVRIRRQFSQRSFDVQELQAAIREARTLLAELGGEKSIHGPARIEGMVDPTERLQAAVDDLFGLPRDADLQGFSVPRLSGIRELYLTLTGDDFLHGGYYPERVRLATTQDFSGLVKNALNKLVANTWEELGRAGYDWWKQVSVQEHFNSLHDITGTLVGTVGDLPSIAEGANYPELKVGDSPETASFTKYGGYIPLTLELIDRNETRKLRAFARELASAGMRKISRLVAAVFTENAGVGRTLADGGTLFNVNAVSTAGGHANLSDLPLSVANWDAVAAKVYRQPMLVRNEAGIYGTGPQLAVNPRYLLVSRSQQKLAMEICGGNFVRESGYVYDNVLKGSAVPVVVPEWSESGDWAAVCDPRVAPAIFVGERFGLAPEVFVAGDELSPAVFTNDEHRLKVRHYLAVWVNDFRPLHKCNVV